jgi:hypothetical protein
MSLIANCIKHEDARQQVVVEEKGKKYHLENERGLNIAVVKVDKCVSQNEGEKRCDFLLQIKRKAKDGNKLVLEKSIFVELKGRKILDGVKQIYETILFLKQEVAINNLECKIVGSIGVPRIQSEPTYLKLLKLVDSKDRITIKTNNFLKEKI